MSSYTKIRPAEAGRASAGLQQQFRLDIPSTALETIDQGCPSAANDTAREGANKRTSNYKGVCWNKKNKRWQTAINAHGRCLYLGSFADEAAAARVYDMAALMVRGPNTKLNFQNESYYDSSGKLVVDQHLHDVIQKHLQVAASARLAAYAAKAAADSLAPGDVGAVVSAAVAALTQQAADNAAAAVQDKSSSAAAAAAVEAVNSAAGAKRQRFMMSEAALRPNLAQRQHSEILQKRPPTPPQSQPLQQQQQQCLLALQQQLAGHLPKHAQDMSPAVPGQSVPAAAAAAAAGQQYDAQHLLSHISAAGSAAGPMQLTQLSNEQPHSLVGGSGGSPLCSSDLQQAVPPNAAACRGGVQSINMRWLMQQLPQGCVVEYVMMGLAGMCGVLYTLPQQQQQQQQGGLPPAAPPAAAVAPWTAVVWDGVGWHQVGRYETEQEATDAASYVLDLAADCFDGMDSEGDDTCNSL